MGHRIPCAAIVERLGMGHQSKAHDHMTNEKDSAYRCEGACQRFSISFIISGKASEVLSTFWNGSQMLFAARTDFDDPKRGNMGCEICSCLHQGYSSSTLLFMPIMARNRIPRYNNQRRDG